MPAPRDRTWGFVLFLWSLRGRWRSDSVYASGRDLSSGVGYACVCVDPVVGRVCFAASATAIVVC